MQIIVGLFLIALAITIFMNFWQLILTVIAGGLIVGFIAFKKYEGMSESEQSNKIGNWIGIYSLCIFIFLVGACMADIDLKSTTNSPKNIKKVETVKIERTTEKTEDVKKSETVQTERTIEKTENVKKSFNVNEWCQRYYSLIYDIENKWKNFRENDSEFVVPMQNLARSMESAHNKMDNLPEYKIPEDIPDDVKNKMKNVIINLYDGMQYLAYSLRVMTEYYEEVSGSNDLPNRILIPYGASEEEIYYYMEKARENYNSAKMKFEISKNLLNEINN